MASDSEQLAYGYKELSNVMQELKEWTAVLFMPIKICNSKGEFLTETYHDMDILQYTSEIGKGYKIYFDISKYPVEDGFSNNSNGWKELHRVLRLQAQNAEYNIYQMVVLLRTDLINIKSVAIKVFCILIKSQGG